MADLALLFAAAAFALMGLLALALPGRVLGQFGVGPLSRDARNEVRAVYGGFGLAVAAALLAGLGHPALRPGICLAVALALFGMAAGRIVSAVPDRGIGAKPLGYLLVEIVVGALVLYAGGLIQAA